MPVSIQTLSYNSQSCERFHCGPVLRQGCGLRPLLSQPHSSPPSLGLEEHGSFSAVHVAPLPHHHHHGHRTMRWRAFQFRDPDDTYVYRARIEPHPPQLPAAAADSKQHTAVSLVHSHAMYTFIVPL